MSIPVFRSYIKRKDMDTVLSCLITDSVGPGEYLERFQKGAREFFGYEFGFALRSPYRALLSAFDALGLAAGDCVALSALSPSYYSAALAERGLLALYADVEQAGGIVSKSAFQAATDASEAKPKAFLWGGGSGVLPDPEYFASLEMPVIEDFSRSLGGLREGAGAHSLGALSILGLEHGSMVTAGGGALLYAHGKREASVLRNFAEALHPVLRMTDFNAALGLAQLRDLESVMEKRREIRRLYGQALAGNRHKAFVQTGEAEAGCWSLPVVVESSAKDAMAYARKKDVETELAFADSAVVTGQVPEGSCPNARSLGMRTLVFPLHQRIGANGAQKIARVLATLP